MHGELPARGQEELADYLDILHRGSMLSEHGPGLCFVERILPEDIVQWGSTAGITASLPYRPPANSVDSGLMSEMFLSHLFYVTMRLYF